ncbi:hypothetical protein BWQ96_05201 [Gracilariopsis chorda]|uniref:Uncharacterized protein n=1 Tax=Gracilariopsis chorda TaxID=448386 RepID=A0A2V3ISC0_9FLOR|nr:hypothetical protein BWQ96_05201 [Gracilariopsis chorda]|eukprot:PXF45028.1 hypothetical protein BWQ96_05201 [Gracilariopsis chorda]
MVPSTIQDVSLVKQLLRIGDDKAINTIKKLAATMSDAPSLLGKLLFIAERILNVQNVASLHLVSLLPYCPSIVADLQRNMLERCYCDYVTHEIEHNNMQQVPMAAAAALRLDEAHAKLRFDGFVLQRIKQLEQKSAKEATVQAEHDEELDKEHLDFVARSGELPKADLHAY